MVKKYYRVSYNSVGIYEALKNWLWKTNQSETWNKLKNSEEFNWLRLPNIYTDKCLSYFTNKGFDIFNERTLPIIKKYLNEEEIIIDCLELDYSNLNIIYEDEHQIVIE